MRHKSQQACKGNVGVLDTYVPSERSYVVNDPVQGRDLVGKTIVAW